MGKLYAWVNPLSFTSELDHTWVTTYDTRKFPYSSLAEVIEAGEKCWLCWGIFHPTGSTSQQPDGYLFETEADIDLSSCLVTPNAASQDDDGAKGTIFLYGIDGVCHQLANQVLYGAVRGGHAPIVEDAEGYWLSSFLYGDYGRTEEAWKEKIAGCTVSAMTSDRSPHGDTPDHLLQHARDILGDDPSVIDAIARKRTEQREIALAMLSDEDVSADEINRANRIKLAELEAELGTDRFIAVFGYTAEEAPDLVDPSIFAASRGARLAGSEG